MKSVTYAEKTWVLGDDATSAILDYAVLLARSGSADSVSLNVLTPDGQPHVISMLIGPATMMTAVESDLDADEPDNGEAVAAIRDRMNTITAPPSVMPAVHRTHDGPWEDLV